MFIGTMWILKIRNFMKLLIFTQLLENSSNGYWSKAEPKIFKTKLAQVTSAIKISDSKKLIISLRKNSNVISFLKLFALGCFYKPFP